MAEGASVFSRRGGSVMVEQSSCLESEDIRAVNRRMILKWILTYGLNSSESGYMPVVGLYEPGI